MKDMTNLFLEVLNLSAVASIVILVVLLARLLLKKAPKVFSYALWAIVLVRLLVPVSISSPVSALPETAPVEQAQINQVLPEIEFETPSDRQENIQSLQNADQNNGVIVQVKRGLEPAYYLTIGWLIGMGGMLLYSAVSYWKIRKKVRVCVPLRDNIYIADDIKSPFVIGFFRPKIYLPCNLREREQEYIILHEQHHVLRFDHVAKLLAFLALTVHWFNPLVWLAFLLASKDMEMSCDEAVIRKAGEGIRAEYAASLLTLATGRRIIAGMPLAFGEGDPKGRINHLAKWKKPALWVILVGVLLCVALAVCLLTDPVADNMQADPAVTAMLEDSVQQAILDHNHSERYEGMCETASFVTLASEGSADASDSSKIETVTFYGLALHQVYSLADGKLVEEGGSHVPVVLTFGLNDSGEYVLTEYWEPRDGTYYTSDIKAKFPDGVWPDTQENLAEQMLDTYAQAMEHYGVGTNVVINTLIEDICAQKDWADGFSALMRNCTQERAMLAVYGTDTLEYCFTEFLNRGNDNIRGQVMAYICNEIMESMGESGLDGWSYQRSGQDWFDTFASNALSLCSKYTWDELKTAYPGSWLYLTMTGNITDLPDWGITLSVQNVTPTGLTILCTRTNAYPVGELLTGSYYVVQKYKDGQWKALEYNVENLGWTTEAWAIPVNDTARWSVDWNWLYGELAPGRYRIGKSIMDFRSAGDYDQAMFYAEFTIE